MRLYKSKTKGQWVGTQRDAQKSFPRDWEEINVPVSKNGLLEFLNIFEVGAKREEVKPTVIESAPPNPADLDPEAHSWVTWAYETLKRGDKAEAEKMLLNGLNKQTRG